jgi:hypothetical protein
MPEAERLRGVLRRSTAPVGRARLRGPFWWQATGPIATGRKCHTTKTDALRAFVADPANARTLEGFELYGDESSRSRLYRHCSGVFDAINAKYDLRGARKVCSIDDAIWHAVRPRPGGRGFCLDEVDLEALNDVAAAAQLDTRFRIPEALIEDIEAERGRRELAEAEAEFRIRRLRRRRAPLETEPTPDYAAARQALDFECEDERGRIVDCDLDGTPIRLARRAGGRRLYLDPFGPAAQAAVEERARFLPLRDSDTSFAFGAEARRAGGPVRAGRPYVVGEAGPELFVPSADGAIVPEACGCSPRTTAILVASGVGLLVVGGAIAVWWRRRRRRKRGKK